MAVSAVAHHTSAGRKTAYARAELEVLRDAPSKEAHVRLWADVRAALVASGFSGEYDGLLVAEEDMRSRRGNKGMQTMGVRKWPEEAAAARSFGVADIGAHKNGGLVVCHEHSVESAHDHVGACGVVEESLRQGEDVEYEDDSGDDYEGILKPAFAVDGDPYFESGEPLDGFEYLRRVRWEANQIPRVKVAKICSSAARNEQTSYMPDIPDIPKCLPYLRASKQWEDTFITDFVETRMVLSELGNSDVSSATKISTKPGNTSEPQTDPTLTMLRNMDAVSRAATLRNYIDMVQSLDALSRNNCVWLFALCVAIHTPLDAETCASLRSLLRKCASILASKTEMDDEVAMLNILMTISGRYFGQGENTN